VQLAEGVDDETWMYHLRRGDYTQWFREMIKDEALAKDAAAVAEAAKEDGTAAPKESRNRIKEAIETRYIAAA
jgi:hypothetical protein